VGRRPGRPAKRVAKRAAPKPPPRQRQRQQPPRQPAEAPRRPSGPKGLGGDQVEGRQAVRELLLAGRRKVREVLVAAGDDDRLDGPLRDLVELAEDLRVAVKQVSRTKLAGVARTDAPQGVVAFAAPLPEADLDDLARRSPDGAAPFLVAVDGVTDPGNLGALLRSAECAGATGVLLPRHRAVHVTATVTKAAAGAVEHLPMALVGGLPATLERLKADGLWIVGLDGGGDTPLHDLPFAADPVVLVLGAEGTGLSRLVRQRCDVLAAIPLRGRLESLNVAAAAAIATYEVARHRA
jgi:23S rRNA (guanosine2251-2'-O)-methyltransferase